MEVKIKLTKENGIHITEPFNVKETENLDLLFQTEYDLHSAKIEVKNGDICGEYDYSQRFAIPEKFMFAGNLFVKIKMFIGKNVAKIWEIMPIKITQTPEGLLLVDFLTSLDDRLKTLEKFHEII